MDSKQKRKTAHKNYFSSLSMAIIKFAYFFFFFFYVHSRVHVLAIAFSWSCEFCGNVCNFELKIILWHIIRIFHTRRMLITYYHGSSSFSFIHSFMILYCAIGPIEQTNQNCVGFILLVGKIKCGKDSLNLESIFFNFKAIPKNMLC